jgi:hypothetical protein
MKNNKKNKKLPSIKKNKMINKFQKKRSNSNQIIIKKGILVSQ